MKKLLYFAFFSIFAFFGGVNSETISMNWLNEDGTLSQTTTCEAGGDIILPTAPTKRGYTFMGWVSYYTPIEYLESTGTQYIDTGILESNTSKIIISLQILQNYVNADQKLFGARGTFYMATLNGYYRGTSVPVSTSETQITIVRNANSKQATFVYDNTTQNITNWWTIAEASSEFPIFGALHSNVLFATYKCFYFKQYDLDGLLVRDMIPVLDENNIPCMYDKVTKQFFYNAGTGNFIAGPVIGSNQ